MTEILERRIGIVLLTGAFLVAGVLGIAASWAAWPRNPNTSPLAALFALTWGGIYLLTAMLTWRRSRLAPIVFFAAIGLLLFPASFIFPGSQLFLPSLIVLLPVAFLGHWYLRKARLRAL